MSGIVSLVHLNGEPIDRSLLHRLTQSMTFRGPDAQQMWLEGEIGFGHTLSKTTWEAEYEHQPLTLDQQVWIVADARIDDRETLLDKLGLSRKLNLGTTPDVELILRAYLTWGEACVQQLLGDFAFVIWDSRQQRLFCARDQFGVKLFYYARVGNWLIISNTLNCVRQHPLISRQLNEQAIGDFLLFDTNYNLETTTFADIQRLPPAHTLTWADGNLKISRYWSLPLPELIRYKRSQDYIDQFHELMDQAVVDRLRLDKVGIFFSGGLDSTTIAAKALAGAKARSQPLDLQAFTVVYDHLIADQERYYSGIAAKALELPIHYLVADDYELHQGWNLPQLLTPEPVHEPLLMASYEQMQQMATHSPVALYGQGGDEGLKGETVMHLMGRMSTLKLGQDIITCLLKHHLNPAWGTNILAVVRRLGKRQPKDVPEFPAWINPEFAARYDLRDRWHHVINPVVETNLQPRSLAHQSLTQPFWVSVFEYYDPGCLKLPLEVRLPFLDLRLLAYLLALPPLPWCVGKQLLRLAMRDALPAEICQRPKSPLAGDPVSIKFQQRLTSAFLPRLELGQYVTLETASYGLAENRPVWNAWEELRVVSLAYWLRHLSTGADLVHAVH